MDFFNVLKMIGGLAFFLYGMHIMGDGLAKTSGGKLEQILEKFTSKPLFAVLLGCGVTAVIQSSSATTVMVVGFVNSGIMKLGQAVGIIMGANIGTTITSWLLSLIGIEGGNFIVQMLKPSSFSPILAAVGVCLILFAKSARKRDVGTILIGFAILMFGMETMSGAVKPLADVPEFTRILTVFESPILGVLAGAVLTAVIQSSSASVGILQALCATGSVSVATAIPIIMGQNIGTCVTALLSAIGANKNAKRAALVHFYFNLIGTILFMVVYYGINAVVHFQIMGKAAGVADIALIHSFFNVAATLALLPFRNLLVKLACLTIRDDDKEEEVNEFQLLDERFLEKPAFAVAQAKKAAIRMSEISREELHMALELFHHYDKQTVKQIQEMEELVDRYEDELGTYVMKIGNMDLSLQDSETVSMLLHCIGDFERISDHGLNLMESAREMHEKKGKFSGKAQEELAVYEAAIREIVDMAFGVFESEDSVRASFVEPLEEVIDKLDASMKKRHIKRLRKGKCTIEQGFILSDISNNFERIADHCSNIAVCLIQTQEDGFETHEYLDNLKEDSPEFKQKYKEFRNKYRLP